MNLFMRSICLMLVLWVNNIFAKTTIVADEKGNGLWHQFVLLDTKTPTPALLEKLTRPIIEQTSVAIRRIVVSSDQALLWDASHKYVMRDVGEDVLIRYRRAASQRGSFLLEVICIGGDCVQRSRDQHGQVREVVVSGSNPLIIHFDGEVASLVYLEMTPAMRFVRLFARVNNGSLGNASNLFARVLQRMQDMNVGLTLRDDLLYFASENIPASFVLWDDIIPLDLDEYRARPFVLCSAWPAPGQQECRVWSYRLSPQKLR